MSPSDRTVVVEAKGSLGKLSINNSKLAGHLKGFPYRQPTRLWLREDADTCYLDVLKVSTDSDIARAVTRIDAVITGGDYDAVVVAAGSATKFGKVDDAVADFHKEAGSTWEMIAVNIDLG
ncbi:MAG: hypothetical protein M3P34_01190 [Actinomycetota bacterium]|nr:hypothetical protein [Actinomycetota bacterium]